MPPWSPIRSMLDQLGTHERNAPTKDANGGDVAGWATVTANVRCAVWPIDTQAAVDFARRDIVVTHAVCTDADLGALAEDRLTIDDFHYVVKGLEPYANAGVAAHGVYVMHCERRTT